MRTDQHLSIAIATCDGLAKAGRNDDAALIDRLIAHGIRTTLIPWTDTDAPWQTFDAVLVRTTWDYMHDLPSFLKWVDRVGSAVPLLNPSSIIRPNTNKTYLRALEPDIVPSIWLTERPDDEAIARAFDEAESRGWSQLAIKPTVDAGAKGLLIAPVSDSAAIRAHIARIASNRGVIIQPLLHTLPTLGELSVVLIDGEITHAVRKTPAPGDHRCQSEFGGRYTFEEPSDDALRLVERARGLWAGEPAPPLFARIDIVEVPTDLTTPDGPTRSAIIEAELIEPELFFPMAPHAADALAAALVNRLAHG